MSKRYVAKAAFELEPGSARSGPGRARRRGDRYELRLLVVEARDDAAALRKVVRLCEARAEDAGDERARRFLGLVAFHPVDAFDLGEGGDVWIETAGVRPRADPTLVSTMSRSLARAARAPNKKPRRG